ncbi:F box domain [Trypanosoma vivax]|nr:F box domain [Trypanosoma vivax]
MFSCSSVQFLTCYQFILPHAHANIPTDSLSLLDVMLHVNSIYTTFADVKYHRALALQHDPQQSRLMASDPLNTDELYQAGQRPAQRVGFHNGGAEAFSLTYGSVEYFDEHLSEEVLAPLLLSFLNFYVDRSVEREYIRLSLRAYFEATPYLMEANNTGGSGGKRDPQLCSSTALLLLRLEEALLRCSSAHALPIEKVVEGTHTAQDGPLYPSLPWLKSQIKYYASDSSSYWQVVQQPSLGREIIKRAMVYRTPVGKEGAKHTHGGDDAIRISWTRKQTTHDRKRAREGHGCLSCAAGAQEVFSTNHLRSRGISPLPYEVQQLILEYLTPRALSAATGVCWVWSAIIKRSSNMSLYLSCSRAVTEAFFRFMKRDWGHKYVRVDELTTIRRFCLLEGRWNQLGRRLESWCLPQLALGEFARRLCQEFRVRSVEWMIAEDMWNAMRVEVKIFPCGVASDGNLFQSLKERKLYSSVPTDGIGSLMRVSAASQLRQCLRWMKQKSKLDFALLTLMLTIRLVVYSTAQQRGSCA